MQLQVRKWHKSGSHQGGPAAAALLQPCPFKKGPLPAGGTWAMDSTYLKAQAPQSADRPAVCSHRWDNAPFPGPKAQQQATNAPAHFRQLRRLQLKKQHNSLDTKSAHYVWPSCSWSGTAD